MASPRKDATAATPRRRPPARTAEARESQLVAQAMALAEQQIQDGTASAAVITHFLKQGSIETKKKVEKLESENALLRAKIDEMAHVKTQADLYQEALAAMSTYKGVEVVVDDGEDY